MQKRFGHAPKPFMEANLYAICFTAALKGQLKAPVSHFPACDWQCPGLSMNPAAVYQPQCPQHRSERNDLMSAFFVLADQKYKGGKFNLDVTACL